MAVRLGAAVYCADRCRLLFVTHIGPNLDWSVTYFAGDHAVYRVVATGALAAQP